MGTFATAAGGGKREQKGVFAVAEGEHIVYAKPDAVTAKGKRCPKGAERAIPIKPRTDFKIRTNLAFPLRGRGTACGG